MSVAQMKSRYQFLRDYFTEVQADFGTASELFGPYPFAELFRGEMCKFAYYMAAMDGQVEEREWDCIDGVLECGRSLEELTEVMSQAGVAFEMDPQVFAESPFRCITIARIADDAYREIGKPNDRYQQLLSLFVSFGIEIAGIEREVKGEEEDLLHSVVDAMRETAEREHREMDHGDILNIDITEGLQLSIGENGSSYIALNLNGAQKAMISEDLADKDVPALFVGNTVCFSCGDQMLRKHLLTGECERKEIDPSIADTVNQSVSTDANGRKSQRIEEVVDHLLRISEDPINIAWINNFLQERKSTLKIVQSENGEYTVLDADAIRHSVEEILWVLSF